MSIQEVIREKVSKALSPSHLEILNESGMHNVPKGSESHFKLVVVSDAFAGLPLLERQRRVNAILADELKTRVHALTMTTLTPQEWQERQGRVENSPPCLGGSKHG